ncbi:MAG: hypothetical protein JO319_00830 [Acidobacteriaceae bacterium]|nr:hypothetical protein [Acidobacteriaceae bacterium]
MQNRPRPSVVHWPPQLLLTCTTWNMLPLGQLLWMKELESFKEFPPLQAPETYT